MSFRIIGTGSAVPSKTVTNEDLSGMMETSDEWIRTRVGVAERRIATTESTADLAYEAAVKALEMSGISADSLDLIVAATITPDRVCPTTAGTVQARLGPVCAGNGGGVLRAGEHKACACHRCGAHQQNHRLDRPQYGGDLRRRCRSGGSGSGRCLSLLGTLHDGRR